MNPALIYDTETTGLPVWKEPSESPAQPHLVQLGAQLVCLDSRKVLQQLDLIIKPEGWTIPQEVSELHGITQEMALDLGVSESIALEAFYELWQCARVRIGHNESFDARIIRIGTKRYFDDAYQDEWKEGAAECTQKICTPICALPPTDKMKAARRFHHKSPNLTEAYQHFFGHPFEGAHSAISDVIACRDVYFAAQDHIAAQAGSQPAEAAAPAVEL